MRLRERQSDCKSRSRWYCTRCCQLFEMFHADSKPVHCILPKIRLCKIGVQILERKFLCRHTTGVQQQCFVMIKELLSHNVAAIVSAHAERISEQARKVVKVCFRKVEMVLVQPEEIVGLGENVSIPAHPSLCHQYSRWLDQARFITRHASSRIATSEDRISDAPSPKFSNACRLFLE